jgi:membrane-associated phospholipid phosphatase
MKETEARGRFGLQLAVGLLIVLLAGWCFSEIAEMLGPRVPPVDQQVTSWFHQHAQSDLTSVARTITFCGSVGFLSLASICLALCFAWRRAWDRLAEIAIVMLGGSLLNILLKHFFHRQRPVLENPLVTLSSFGFPSGHTMGATLFYGFLALAVARSIRDWRWRATPFIIAALIVCVIGLTRIYLGAHYLTDVLAAIAAGIVWLAFSWTAVETFRRRRQSTARSSRRVATE